MKYQDKAQAIFDNMQEPEDVVVYVTSDGATFVSEKYAECYQAVLDAYNAHGNDFLGVVRELFKILEQA